MNDDAGSLPLLDTALLRRARIASGYTERGLARHLGTSPLRIRRIEAGIAHDTVTIAMLTKLAAAIGVDPAQLLRSSSAPPPAPPSPRRALSLPEARVLHRALHGEVPMAARDIAGAATAHLITTGVLLCTCDDPATATRITVADDVLDCLSPTPPAQPRTQSDSRGSNPSP